jgi:eukaryotic-like serine/threonine-protein kinase
VETVTESDELKIRLSSVATLGRIVRAALRYGTTRLPADLVPGDLTEEVLMQFEAAGFEKTVSVVGQKSGAIENGLVPYKFRPRTRVGAAELFVINEMIDVPPETMPPPSTSDMPRPISAPPIDDTIVERVVVEEVKASRSVAVPKAPPAPNVPAPPLRNPLLDRTLAGKYKLEVLLGQGNAGAVWRGVHTELGRPVAVKVLHAQNQRENQFVKRFKAEARAASRLDHRNVTRVLDFGQEEDGLLYLVMEYVDGKSLETMLQTDGRLPQTRVIDIGIQVCSALALAHKEGIIHRDIKPDNLLLVPALDDDFNTTDLVKVCDFGMAKLKASGEELTVGGMICGSPAYMSPEQIKGKELDARTDIYALGMTMYEAVTGCHPFAAETLVELFMKHQFETPRSPRQLVPELDPLLEDILLRTLAKRPEGRHDSVRTLRMELRVLADQLREQGPPSSVVSGR